jgi:4-alpha-glucanotransferase
MTRLYFVPVFHNHQPVGNDPRIIEHVAQMSYRPLLEALDAVPWLRHALHVSGPLLTWMEAADPDYLDRLGTMVARGQVELLTGGLYEPILAAIPSADRIAQVTRLSDRIEQRFGVRPQGLWLTERVWEPQIVPDLVAAGVRYVFMDDRAFIAAGIPRERLTAHFVTEEGGERLAIFPLDQRLRTLIPWAPPDEAIACLDQSAATQRVAVFGDDGEKFGAWPETHAKVYGGGWLRAFFAGLERLAERVETARPADVMATVEAAGLCYLPTSSYSEMEEWALPPAQAMELARLKDRVGDDADRFAPFLRGSHWKHFLVRYSEANRAHKKMLALRSLLPARARWHEAWQELYAAQCNDSYWHGWFGGVYLPQLRHQTWMRLARVERAVRRGEGLRMEQVDLDLDGHPEVWIHAAAFSALLQPHRGGTLVEWSDLRREINVLNVLSRRPEWYHARMKESWDGQAPGAADQGSADLREGLAYDLWDRASFRDRFLGGPLSAQALSYRALEELGDFVDTPYGVTLGAGEVTLARTGSVRTSAGVRPMEIRKSLQFDPRGRITAAYRLATPDGEPFEGWFGIELNFFLPGLVAGNGTIRVGRRRLDPATPGGARASGCVLADTPGGAEVRVEWDAPADLMMSPVRTASQTERGFELTCQGHVLVVAWLLQLPAGGEWTMQIRAGIAGSRAGVEGGPRG